MALRPASVGRPSQGLASRRGLLVAMAPQDQHQVNSPLSDWLILCDGWILTLPTLTSFVGKALGGAGKLLLLKATGSVKPEHKGTCNFDQSFLAEKVTL